MHAGRRTLARDGRQPIRSTGRLDRVGLCRPKLRLDREPAFNNGSPRVKSAASRSVSAPREHGNHAAGTGDQHAAVVSKTTSIGLLGRGRIRDKDSVARVNPGFRQRRPPLSDPHVEEGFPAAHQNGQRAARRKTDSVCGGIDVPRSHRSDHDAFGDSVDIDDSLDFVIARPRRVAPSVAAERVTLWPWTIAARAHHRGPSRGAPC